MLGVEALKHASDELQMPPPPSPRLFRQWFYVSACAFVRLAQSPQKQRLWKIPKASEKENEEDS